MSNMTLVNGENAKDGSVQIGAITNDSDVPITEYKYAPVEIDTDPEFTVIINPQDLSDAELRVRQLSDIQRSISESGVNYDSVVTLESICPGIIMSNFPEAGYSSELSMQSQQITLERIDGAKLGGIIATIIFLIGGIFALFSKIRDMVTGNKRIVLGDKEFTKTELRNKNDLPEIANRVSRLNNAVSSLVAAKTWLLENGLPEIINLHSKLSPDLNVNSTVTNTEEYLRRIGYGDTSRNSIFNLDNIIGAEMPNIFYTQDLGKSLTKYNELLKTLPEAIKKRLDSTGAILDSIANVKRGYTFSYSPRQDLIINVVSKFTGIKSYLSETEALEDLQRTIRKDWAVENRIGDVTRKAIANVMSRDITTLVNSIISSHESISQTFDRLEKTRTYEIKAHARILENTKTDINKILAGRNVSELQRTNYTMALAQLESVPGVMKAEFTLISKLATLSMMPIINVSRATNAMNTRIRMYNTLLDKIVNLLSQFEKHFGEDLK